MSEERYIAALEISSSKVIGIVGRTRGAGQVDVIAVEQEKHIEAVRYGLIQNVEETHTRIARVIEKLERKPSIAPRKIRSVFVGLSGMSVRSITTKVRMQLPDESEITEEILEKLHKDALSTAIDHTLEVVDAVARTFKVGKTETKSPKGMIGNSIEATYDVIVCRPSLKRNILRAVHEKLGIEVEGFVVTALATAHLVLQSDEKRLGCMLVDMGAETTTVAIFRNGSLYYFATLPLGGRNITKDITSLSTLEERAEEIKITSGNALPPESPSNLNLNGIRLSDVSNLIVARAEEIVANIAEQLVYAGVEKKDLPGGIICIGGGSKLHGITELLTRQTGLPAKIGRLPGFVHLEDTKAPSSEIVEVGSIMYAGATLTNAECLEMPHQQEVPPTGEKPDKEEETDPEDEPKNSGPSFGERFKSLMSRLFVSTDEDDSGLLE